MGRRGAAEPDRRHADPRRTRARSRQRGRNSSPRSCPRRSRRAATHLVLDMPVGPTAKVRSQHAAEALKLSLAAVGARFRPQGAHGGRGRHPAGGARHRSGARSARRTGGVAERGRARPPICAMHALALAAALLELGGAAQDGEGQRYGARGARKRPGLGQVSAHLRGAGRHAHAAAWRATVRTSAPRWRGASNASTTAGSHAWRSSRARPKTRPQGWNCMCASTTASTRGQPLYTVHANAPGQLTYALDFARANADILTLVP